MGNPPTSANYCTIVGNYSLTASGGASKYYLNHCLVIGNQGSGATSCRLFNCTVLSNSVGVTYSQVLNSIVYYNSSNYPTSTVPYFSHSCTTPLPGYSVEYHDENQNITNEPLFVDVTNGDFHLQSNSPCINSGYNGFLMLTNNEYDTTNVFQFTTLTNDFDGNPRIVAGTVDIGAYEFQTPASKISYAWLLQYGLALDGSADNADPDGDRMSNWQEWRAGTLPLVKSSALVMLRPSISASGTTLNWQSQTNVTYYLQRATNLVVPFSTIQSNIVGFTGKGPFFYRVGVQ
jgi:hypothetical protein